MNVDIIEKNFSLNVYGFSGIAINNNWGQTGSRLMDEMWKQVRANNLKHKGLNIWVYEEHSKMFAGVELEEPSANTSILEQKNIRLTKYAYCKHIGPYNLIGKAGDKVTDELKQMGLKTRWPYIEIYGHWTPDENKLETELLWCLV